MGNISSLLRNSLSSLILLRNRAAGTAGSDSNPGERGGRPGPDGPLGYGPAGSEGN